MSETSVAVTCNKDCGAGCPLVAVVRDGRVARVRNNPLGGRAMKDCVRGFEMPRVVYAPDRVLQPLLRTGARGSGQYREAEWSEALELVARRLAEVYSRHGAGSILEREDIVFPAGGNYLLYSNRAVPPRGQARDDYDIFCRLAERMGLGSAFSEGRSEREWLECFLTDSDVTDAESFRQTGIFWGADRVRVGLRDFALDPKAYPLNTPSGKVEIASAAYALTGFPAVPTCRMLAPDPVYPLWLVTPHARFRTHSQYETIAWFKSKTPQMLWMHPADAAARGIVTGDLVLVRSLQGRMRIAAYVTDGIMPGVTSLLQGTWPTLDADGTETAGCANVLTSTDPTLPSYGPRTHSVQVQVEKDLR